MIYDIEEDIDKVRCKSKPLVDSLSDQNAQQQ